MTAPLHTASLPFQMADQEVQKSFKLCLAWEKLEFQEALTQAVSSLVS